MKVTKNKFETTKTKNQKKIMFRHPERRWAHQKQAESNLTSELDFEYESSPFEKEKIEFFEKEEIQNERSDENLNSKDSLKPLNIKLREVSLKDRQAREDFESGEKLENDFFDKKVNNNQNRYDRAQPSDLSSKKYPQKTNNSNFKKVENKNAHKSRTRKTKKQSFACEQNFFGFCKVAFCEDKVVFSSSEENFEHETAKHEDNQFLEAEQSISEDAYTFGKDEKEKDQDEDERKNTKAVSSNQNPQFESAGALDFEDKISISTLSQGLGKRSLKKKLFGNKLNKKMFWNKNKSNKNKKETQVFVEEEVQEEETPQPPPLTVEEIFEKVHYYTNDKIYLPAWLIFQEHLSEKNKFLSLQEKVQLKSSEIYQQCAEEMKIYDSALNICFGKTLETKKSKNNEWKVLFEEEHEPGMFVRASVVHETHFESWCKIEIDLNARAEDFAVAVGEKEYCSFFCE